jgi:hypothetical protein
MTTVRVLPRGGAAVSALVPPPPAPPQRAYSAGKTASAVTTASTATSSNLLSFGSGNVPTNVLPGMMVTDTTTPGALTGGAVGLSVASINAAAGTITLSANANATVNAGDTIVFSNGLFNPFLDIPGDATGDAAAIASSGFVIFGTSGPSSSRPSNPPAGSWHVDTTLGFAVAFDGSFWRNPITGAAV